jgi:hypothetical protein
VKKSPLWCTKPSPCDYDKVSAYCPHRECRQKLEKMLFETNEAAVIAMAERDAALSREGDRH